MAVDLRVSDTAGKVASRATPKIVGHTGPSPLTSRVTGGIHNLQTSPFSPEGVKQGKLPPDATGSVSKARRQVRRNGNNMADAIGNAAKMIGLSIEKKHAPLDLGISGLTTSDIPAKTGFFSSSAPSDFTASLAMMNEGGFVKKRNT
jgi:hypothetical protein